MRKAWGISLLLLGLTGIFTIVSSMVGFRLPDMLIRIIGVADLIGLVVLVYTSVKLKIWKKPE